MLEIARHFLRRRGALAGWLLLIPAAHGTTQPDDVDPFHWGYSAAFGGGVYRLDDGTEAKAYRGTFSVSLRDTTAARPGLRLLLPVAIGLQNLDDDDLPLDRPTDRVEHATFVPGVQLEHVPAERWTLRTSAQLGIGKQFEGAESSARLAAVGLRSRARFDEAFGAPALITGLQWAGFDPELGERRSLLRFTTALELDFRAARWRVRDQPMHWRPHVLKDWYYRPPPALAFGDDDAELLDDEWQIGVAAVREGGFKIGFLEFEGVGVAYRFSDQSAGLRLYLGSVF